MLSEAFAYHRPDLAAQWERYGRFTRMSLVRGALYTGPDYVQAQRFRSYFKRVVAEAMADLGYGVMDDAMVEAAAYVLQVNS